MRALSNDHCWLHRLSPDEKLAMKVSMLCQEKKARLEDMYDDFGRLKKEFRKGRKKKK